MRIIDIKQPIMLLNEVLNPIVLLLSLSVIISNALGSDGSKLVKYSI
jgi:hypothetical protein